MKVDKLLNIQLMSDDVLYNKFVEFDFMNNYKNHPTYEPNREFLLDEKCMFYITLTKLRRANDFHVSMSDICKTMLDLYSFAPFIINNSGSNYSVDTRTQTKIFNLPFFVVKCLDEINGYKFIRNSLCESIYRVSKDIFPEEFDQEIPLKQYLIRLQTYNG